MVEQEHINAQVDYISSGGAGAFITETSAEYIMISEPLVITEGERQTLEISPRLRSDVINGDGGMMWVLERSGNVVTAELVVSNYLEQEKVIIENLDIPEGVDDNEDPIVNDPQVPVTFEMIRSGSREDEGFAVDSRRVPILVEVTESSGTFTLRIKVKGYAGISCTWTIANMNLY